MKTNTSHKYEIVPWLRRAASFGTNYENLSASSSSADEQVAEEAPSTDYAESLEGDSAFGKSHQAPLTRYPQNFCCSINFSWKTNISLIMLACVTMVMLLLIAAPGVCPHNPEAVFRPLLDPTSNGVVTDAMKKKKIFNILFYGDSMLSAPIQRYSDGALLHLYRTGRIF